MILIYNTNVTSRSYKVETSTRVTKIPRSKGSREHYTNGDSPEGYNYKCSAKQRRKSKRKQRRRQRNNSSNN